MKLEVRATFLRDLKQREFRRGDRERLLDFYDDVVAGHDLAALYGEHLLRGEWAGYLECHLDDDWLVIYRRNQTVTVLHRSGTHAELFDK